MQRDLCAHPAQPRRPSHRLTCTANAAGALLFGICVPVLSERVVASDLKFSDQTVGSRAVSLFGRAFMRPSDGRNSACRRAAVGSKSTHRLRLNQRGLE